MHGSRVRLPRGRLVAIAFVALMATGAALVWYGLAAPAGSADSARQVGLAYSRSEMQWYSGPAVEGTYTIPLRQLRTTLARAVQPPSVATDVNVPDLIRQYGPDRRVVLVVVYGVYNSLPPDEGSEVRGDAVVIVDAHSNRVLLLQD